MAGNRRDQGSRALPRVSVVGGLDKGGEDGSLQIYRPHASLGIALARGDALWRCGVDPSEVALGQHYVERSDIFLDPLGMPGSRNRHDVISLREHPGERELRGRALVLLRDLFHPRDQLEILVEVLTLESRVLSPEIVGGEIVDALDLSG